MNDLFYILDLIAVAVFAITGALEAGQRKMDLFGVIVVAIVTAIGGGTLRDILLGRLPVYWVHDMNYIFSTVGAALFTFVTVRKHPLPQNAFLFPDAIGLGLFNVIGVAVALKLNVPWLIASIMGVITAVFGGVIRDVLCNQIPLIFRTEIYATAAWLGGLLQIGLLSLGMQMDLASVISMVFTILLRMAAIYWGISLPTFKEKV